MTTSKRLDVRVSQTLYRYIEKEAKRLGFRTKSEYVRNVFESMRLKDREKQGSLI